MGTHVCKLLSKKLFGGRRAFFGVDWGTRADGWILEFEGVARGDLGGWKHLGRGLWFDRLTTNGDRVTTNADKLTTNGAETVRQGEQGWGGRRRLPLARLMTVDAPLAPT